MDETPSLKAVVWANVLTLMQRHYGGQNLTRLGRDSGIQTGGAQRLQKGADVGLSLLERVAAHFDVQPWQLLAPRLGESMRLSADELEAVRKLREPTQPTGPPAATNVRGLPERRGSGTREISSPWSAKRHPNRREGDKKGRK